MVKKDGEYSGAEDSEDDEETIAQEEKTSKRLDYKEEITDLEREGKIGGCKLVLIYFSGLFLIPFSNKHLQYTAIDQHFL